MKKIGLALVLSILYSFAAFSQINEADSTVQVIGYWDKDEKQTYTITVDKYKVIDDDTSDRKKSSFNVDVTIIDSTAKAYTIEWAYDYSAFLDDSIAKQIKSVIPKLRVIIKTDELGAFQEVVNWREVRNYMKDMLDVSLGDLKDRPDLKTAIDEIHAFFSTKEAIESVGVKDVLQFYTFHGGKYKLGEELTDAQKLPNIIGGTPFDAEVTVLLDEIDIENENSILRTSTVVDSLQLTNTAYEFLKKTAQKTGVAPPKKEEFPSLINETNIASRIHGPSGWVIYSIFTKIVSANNVLAVEERVIEIQ